MVSGAQFLVPSLARDQREDVIREPIRMANASIESALVERLLTEGGSESDQLPVLQHCLARMWSLQQASRRLDLDAYRRAGGIKVALSQHANEIMASPSSPDSRASSSRCFARLRNATVTGARRGVRSVGQLVDDGMRRGLTCARSSTASVPTTAAFCCRRKRRSSASRMVRVSTSCTKRCCAAGIGSAIRRTAGSRSRSATRGGIGAADVAGGGIVADRVTIRRRRSSRTRSGGTRITARARGRNVTAESSRKFATCSRAAAARWRTSGGERASAGDSSSRSSASWRRSTS